MRGRSPPLIGRACARARACAACGRVGAYAAGGRPQARATRVDLKAAVDIGKLMSLLGHAEASPKTTAPRPVAPRVEQPDAGQRERGGSDVDEEPGKSGGVNSSWRKQIGSNESPGGFLAGAPVAGRGEPAAAGGARVWRRRRAAAQSLGSVIKSAEQTGDWSSSAIPALSAEDLGWAFLRLEHHAPCRGETAWHRKFSFACSQAKKIARLEANADHAFHRELVNMSPGNEAILG